MGSPVYIQIHNQIKKDIEAGVWAVGDRIPSERELALEFNVSRMTLRQAVQTLVEEGILERQVGAGTFVARKKSAGKNDRRDEFYGVDGRTRQKTFQSNGFLFGDDSFFERNGTIEA